MKRPASASALTTPTRTGTRAPTSGRATGLGLADGAGAGGWPQASSSNTLHASAPSRRIGWSSCRARAPADGRVTALARTAVGDGARAPGHRTIAEVPVFHQFPVGHAGDGDPRPRHGLVRRLLA